MSTLKQCTMDTAPDNKPDYDSDMGPALTRDEILASMDREIVAVETPEWGGHVYVRVMSGRERDAMEISALEAHDKRQDFRARLAAFSVCDRGGNLLFSKADIEALAEKSGAALSRVLEASVEINKLSEQDQEDLIQNFDDAPKDDSGSV